MNSPPPTFLSIKRKIGPNQKPIPEGVSDDFADGLKKASPENMVMGFTVSPRYNVDLLQNCDLPPPAKFFSGDSDLVLRKATAMMQQSSPSSSKVGETEDDFTGGISDGKLNLLRALRLSQTRAREAEKKIVEMSAEKERLSALLLGESLQLFAHHQLLKLLEMELEYLHWQVAVSLRAGNEREQEAAAAAKTNDIVDGSDADSAWCVAFAVCLGIASVGFVLGCSYWF